MSICKECGLSVEWKRESQTWQCFNPDGSVHWDKCSATKFARIKRTGIPFAARRIGEQVEGYKTPLKKSGEQLTRAAADVIEGDCFELSGACKNCVPPWEVCEKCPDKLEAA